MRLAMKRGLKALLAACCVITMAAQDRNLDDRLLAAVSKGDLKAVSTLLANGANSRATTSDGVPALSFASNGGFVEIVKSLLANGADVNATNRVGMTSLMWAAKEGHLEVVETLLAHGADLHLRTKEGFTALFNAAQNGQPKLVESLVAAGADVNARPDGTNTPLISAAALGYAAVVDVLLRAGADPNIQNKYGFTALMAAADRAHPGVVEALLRDRANSITNLSLVDKAGNTALSLAKKKKNQQIVASIEAASASARGPATEASTQEHTSVAAAIAAKPSALGLPDANIVGANPAIKEAQNSEPASAQFQLALPLLQAARSGNLEDARHLLDSGVDINAAQPAKRLGVRTVETQPGAGRVAGIVLYTILRPQSSIALPGLAGSRFLEPFAEDAPNGMDALTTAVMAGQTDMVALLLERGANPNRRVIWKDAFFGKSTDPGIEVRVPTHREATPLLLAAARHDKSIVQQLLAKGADPMAADELGITAQSFLDVKEENINKPSQIRFFRPGSFSNKFVGIQILVDGLPVAEIGNNKHFSITVNAGSHWVSTASWEKPHPVFVTATPGQNASVRIHFSNSGWDVITSQTIVSDNEAAKVIKEKKLNLLKDNKILHSNIDYWTR